MQANVNKKFSVSDALYQSVMEVMKKDKGSIPRNEKEKDLAAHHGDPNRITHGDVLKARGVTREEVEQVDEIVKIFHNTSDGANLSRNAKNPNDAAAVSHRKAAADAAKKARAGGNFKFKGNSNITPLTPKSSGGDVQAVRSEEVEEFDEALVGNQHKIDANKNNKIDAHDFKLLRAKKKTNEGVDKGGKLEIEDRKK